MSLARFRQMARLEKLAELPLKIRQETERDWQSTLHLAVGHAATLSFIIRYGNPQIGEPLSLACQRVAELDVWREYCEKFPLLFVYSEREYAFEPHSRDSVLIIGGHLRHAVVTMFGGADEKEKLDAVFASAPAWLVWFTFADYTARLLGLKLPDLSGVTGFARPKANFDLWCGVPREAFEPSPWPKGLKNGPFACAGLNLALPATQWPHIPMPTRKQKRAGAPGPVKCCDRWPHLFPSKVLMEGDWLEFFYQQRARQRATCETGDDG